MDEYYLKKAYLSMNLQFFADSAADKTEEPTAKKLQDARKEGQVAKSQELISGAMLFAFFIAIKLFGGYMANSFIKVFHRIPTNWAYEQYVWKSNAGYFTDDTSNLCFCPCNCSCTEYFSGKMAGNKQTVTAKVQPDESGQWI